MRRKYGDCQRADGNCTLCPLVNDWRDCHDLPISKLKWHRLAAHMSQLQLADAAGVHISLIRKVEGGDAEPGNLTAKNLLALADVLGVDPRDLI